MAPHEGPPPNDASESRARSLMRSAKTRLQAVGRVCRARPHVVLVPLVVCGLMMGLGVWAVLQGAAEQADSRRREAQSQVDSAASSLQLTVQRAIMPLEQAADWVSYVQNYTTINRQWEERAKGWWKGEHSPTDFMVLSTAGWGTNVYPTTPLSQAFLGLDSLALWNPGRPESLRVIREKNVTITAISMDTVLNRPDAYLIAVILPVYISNVSRDETWSQPYNATECPPDVCYDNATRTKWWGGPVLFLQVAPFLSSSGPLQDIAKLYNWQIFVPPIGGVGAKVPLGGTSETKTPSPAVVKGLVRLANMEWDLYIWPNSWEPDWKVPLIITVVVVSLVVAALLFAVLLSREEHQVLLTSLLPKATINRLRHEIDWEDLEGTKHDLNLVEIETPAQQMLTILRAILDGAPPPMPMVLAVQRALQQSMDVYRPPNKELRTRLEAMSMDDEARMALERQLGGSTSWPSVTRESLGQIGVADGEEAEDEDLADGAVVSRDPRSMIHAMLVKRPHRQASALSVDDGVSLTSAQDDTHPIKSQASIVSQDHGSAGNDSVLTVDRPVMEEVDRLLAQATDSWTFDAYALHEATQGHPLSVLAFWLMHTSGCVQRFSIDAAVMARFLRRVELGYAKANPYHNARHAADVLQTLHMVLHHGGVAPGYADPHTVLACYLAAVVHDFEHTGVSTDYLVSTGDRLAVLYNDRSPMENHHLAAAWTLLTQPQYNFVRDMSKESLAKLRKLVIELVLATDMKQHFSIMGQFSAQHTTNGTLCDTSGRSTDDGRATPLQPVNDGERVLSLQMALKCADLGHLAESLPVHLKWVQDLEQEFFLQGDQERARSMPISPLCDRTKEGITKSQVGFFEFVAMPLFSHFTARFKQAKPLLNQLMENYTYWKGVAAAAAAGHSAEQRSSRSSRGSAKPGLVTIKVKE